MRSIEETLAAAHAHHVQGRWQQAERLYQQILQVDPHHPDALHLLGVLAHQAGKHEIAISLISQAIRRHGSVAGFHNNLGEACRKLGRFADAVAAYRQAVRLDPTLAEAHNNLGNVLLDQGSLTEALAAFQQAARLRPDSATIWFNLGNCHQALRDYGAAEAAYHRALAIDPMLVDAHINWGTACHDQGNLSEALACFDRAIAIRPDDANARYSRARIWLALGDYARGWPEYEWRWQREEFRRRPLTGPAWEGEPLAGRTLLVQAEQGLGDTLQFVRYLSHLQRSGETVFCEVQESLIPLLAQSGFERLVPQDGLLPDFDVHTTLLTLPRLLYTTLDTIPADISYLFADRQRIETWRPRFAGLPGFKIGIHWQGNPRSPLEPWRSFPLAAFEPLARFPGTRLISLQKRAGTEQIAALANRFVVEELGPALDPQGATFLDTAAVMTLLDLVITSDSAVAHLAGALGLPVWVVLPLAADWRWLRDRTDSPWYPTMRLFRQTDLGQWSDVFDAIARELQIVLQTKTGADQVP